MILADIELKEAQRFFAQKFSCGASVTAEDEIIIQGDFTDDIIDVIQEKWPEVSCLKCVDNFSLFVYVRVPLLPSTYWVLIWTFCTELEPLCTCTVFLKI